MLRYKTMIPMDHAPISAPKKPGDVGYDLAVSHAYNYAGGVLNLHTGVAVELPPNTWGLIRLRSGFAATHGAMLASSGVIDNGYRGEIIIPVAGIKGWCISAGTRVAQLIVMPMIRPPLEQVDTLSETDRDGGGFGSTGAA